MTLGNLFTCRWAFGLFRRAPSRHQCPYQPDQPGHHAVCDFSLLGVTAHFEAESAVNDPERDQDPTVPDVCRGPDVPPAGSLEGEVMEVTEGGLDYEEADDDEANNGVVLVDLIPE